MLPALDVFVQKTTGGMKKPTRSGSQTKGLNTAGGIALSSEKIGLTMEPAHAINVGQVNVGLGGNLNTTLPTIPISDTFGTKENVTR
jgi:hypothetical protein